MISQNGTLVAENCEDVEKMAETNTEAKLKITNLEAYGLELPPNSLGVEKGMTYQQE